MCLHAFVDDRTNKQIIRVTCIYRICTCMHTKMKKKMRDKWNRKCVFVLFLPSKFLVTFFVFPFSFRSHVGRIVDSMFFSLRERFDLLRFNGIVVAIRLRSISVSLSMIIVEWNYGGFGQSRRKSNRTRCTVLIINDFNWNKTRNDFETVVFEARDKTFALVDRRRNNNDRYSNLTERNPISSIKG